MTKTASPTPLDRALVEEATKKSGLIWVRGETGPSRALWHVWHDGAVFLVGGGPGEQPFAGLGLTEGARALVTVRSKDKGGRLIAWQARVTEPAPRSEEWSAAVAELRAKRLNAPDASSTTERWARECRVLRLTPEESPARTDFGDAAHAAPPLPTDATTRRPMPAALPRLLGRGRRK